MAMAKSQYKLEFKEIVLDDQGIPLKSIDGRILCHVLNNGTPDTMFIKKEDLINSGLVTEDLKAVEEYTLCPTEENAEIDENDGQLLESTEENTWTSEITKFLLDKYHEYLPEIGPMKKFKIKKRMWEQISSDLQYQFNIRKSSQQVENRFKTVLKRKKAATKTNRSTGQTRKQVEYDEELKKIASQDDSIEPEILKDHKRVVINKENEKPKRVKNHNLYQLLKDLNEDKKTQRERHFTEKEEQKERRHQEKMELFREFLQRTQ